VIPGSSGISEKWLHLVHVHALESIVVLLEHVEQPNGLAVGERDDHVGARADVIEDVLGRDCRGGTSRHAGFYGAIVRAGADGAPAARAYARRHER
jgi:hypothetical protein